MCVLIVDDEQPIREFASEVLLDGGHETMLASTADEAAMLLRADASKITYLLTDLHMPESQMTGMGLAKLVQREYPAIKVVLMSGHLSPTEADQLPFLRKPWSIQQLERQIPPRD